MEYTINPLLLETLTDIAFLAGSKGLYSGNSREDVRTFRLWAEEFEERTKDVQWNEDINRDYISEVEEFFNEKAATFEVYKEE